ncbi:hypothetical protein NA56DRAFT_570441, partial [Hyaloscypha hepaticicola]
EKKEVYFNRIFILYLDNRERVVARVLLRISGRRRLITNSGVAIITYRIIESVRRYF